MKNIFMICMMLVSVSAFAADNNRFNRANGVVSDTLTGLEWQDEYVTDTNPDGNYTYTTWSDAIDYCEALELDGKKDWRLPNINELISIVNYDAGLPAVYRADRGYDGGFEQMATANGDSRNPEEYRDGSPMQTRQNRVRYWTSTTVDSDNDRAWYVNNCEGFTRDSSGAGDDKADKHVVRCVRGPVSPPE